MMYIDDLIQNLQLEKYFYFITINVIQLYYLYNKMIDKVKQ